MSKRPHKGLRRLPVNNLLPNVLTVLALAAGMTAIRYSLEERWEWAALAIVVAAGLDAIDGRIARLLLSESRFGAELDSLSDFIAFGVAPGLLLYLWAGHGMGDLGWIAALAYVTCCGLRLARFNVALDDPDRPPWASNFFSGLSAPGAAGFAMLPLMLSFEIGEAPWRLPELVTLWLVVAAVLMVSGIPTFSLKRLRIRRAHVLPALLIVGLSAAILISYPWVLLPIMCFTYLCSIPFAVRSHRRLAASTAAAPPPEEAEV
jgi:CDP-diacylglycerol--serine O-phosphatidyltransferase